MFDFLNMQTYILHISTPKGHRYGTTKTGLSTGILVLHPDMVFSNPWYSVQIPVSIDKKQKYTKKLFRVHIYTAVVNGIEHVCIYCMGLFWIRTCSSLLVCMPAPMDRGGKELD